MAFHKSSEDMINEAISKARQAFRDDKDNQKGFAEIRKAVSIFGETCGGNAEVTIKIEGVLDHPFQVKTGTGEKKLSIII